MPIEHRYQQALEYLYSLVDFETGTDVRSAQLFDLRRVYEVLSLAGNPHLDIPAVHIAGTKGKGSTAAMIASVLTQAGYKTGLYTSPHLIDLVERISVDSVSASHNELIDLVDEVRPLVAEINRRAVYGCLTTFEVLTVMAFIYFHRKGVRFQVLETGLGGRLDATNVVRPEIVVITSIGIDHADVLGHTLAEIASQKAGIIKPGCDVISATHPEEAAMVIRATCKKMGVELVEVGGDICYQQLGFKKGKQLFNIKTAQNQYAINLPLLGSYQGMNLACAIGALEAIEQRGYSLSSQDIETGMRKVIWPGRFQIVTTRPRVIIDGAHNPDAIKALVASLKIFLDSYHRTVSKKILIICVSRDKDLALMAQEIHPVFDEVVATRSRHPRSMEAEAVAGQFAGYGVTTRVSWCVEQALDEVLGPGLKDQVIVITGSLFVAGEALGYFQAR
jgi:dihydrofolate synthase/folylpolyglutamate synthase